MKSTILLGTRKGLIVYRQKNGTWRYECVHFLGIPVSIATIDRRNGSWWAMLDHGHWGCKIHHSSDEGRSWEELDAPQYPQGAEVKDGIPASTNYLWAFSEGGDEHPDRIYIGTEPGGLFISEDNGKHFQLVQSLWEHPSRKHNWFGGGRDHAAIHSIIVDPRNNEHIYVAISCAGVFESLDSGRSWVSRNKGLKADFLPDPAAEVGQDPHILVASLSDPEVMWQQNHCGIYRSIDGGMNWQDVTEEQGPAYFGFALAVDEKDSQTAWVVPAISDETRVAIDRSLCVCRTEDGGKNWQALRNGLPQEHTFDIVFRHSLDVCEDSLVFGTTTGNLYFSSDRGDHWEALNHNLPMVYSIKFV